MTSTSADSWMSAGRDQAGAALDELELDRVSREALETELLDVEDDLSHVLLHAGDAREFVVDVTNLDRRNGRALQRGQQDPSKGVAQSDAVAGRKRARLVLGVRAELFDRRDLRALEFDHLGALPRVVLDHELLIEVERHLVAARGGQDGTGELRPVDAEPLRDLARLDGLNGLLEGFAAAMRLADLDLVARPSCIDGMLATRPFTAKWAWPTIWRASARDTAKPMR
jgi:hypothetical protein